MTGLQLNAFIRHARLVRMANLAQIVNVIAPLMTRPDGLVLQTLFHPFEIYSRACGDTALDVHWAGDTFAGGPHTGVRVLDVAATLDAAAKRLALFVVNRTAEKATEAEIALVAGQFAGPVEGWVVNGPDIKAQNTFDAPNAVTVRNFNAQAGGTTLRYTFEPHSVTALVLAVK
jgi:alpha-N-arabinofuranosidase